jgi:hypothetical protein
VNKTRLRCFLSQTNGNENRTQSSDEICKVLALLQMSNVVMYIVLGMSTF